MIHLKTYKTFEQSYNNNDISNTQYGHTNVTYDDEDTTYRTPAVGDIVYINYKIRGGNEDYEPTPVKIIEIQGSGKNVTYIASHKVDMSKFKNAPNLSIKKSDIIGLYKGIDTPVGYGWVAKNPNINTGVNQVSNDMYL